MSIFHPLTDIAIESDCLYFEMAAEKQALTGGELVWMPGLESLSSASVVQRIDHSLMPDQCISEAESFCLQHNISTIRLYLKVQDPRWSKILTQFGFISRSEYIMIADQRLMDGWSDLEAIELHPVSNESDWRERYRMLSDSENAPDGYAIEADKYIEMEKRKSATGQLSFYLARDSDGIAVGSVGLMHVGSIRRIKNLLVRPDVRQKGVATRMITQIRRNFPGEDIQLAALAVDHPVRGSVYDRLGFINAATYFEWRKSISRM